MSIEDDLAADDETYAPGYPTGLHVGPLAHPDRYELLGPPLEGAEGITWRARYLGALDRPVQMAVKVLKRPLGASGDWPQPEVLEAWRDRVELLRTASIRGLVRLFDVEAGLEPHLPGVRDTPATILIEMEWVEGRSLRQAVIGRPATWESLPARLEWLDDLATALAGLHGLDTAAVHRDVSPNNCIVTPAGRLVLIDLSTMQLPVDGADPLGHHTPAYSAPEVLAAPFARREPAADRWALGAIAHACLTGRHPPRSSALRSAELEHALQALGARPDAAAPVVALMDEDPSARPADLVDWVDRLRRSLVPVSRGRRPSRPVRAQVDPLTSIPTGVVLGVVVAISAFLQVRGIPDVRADELQRWIAAAAAFAIGATTLAIRWRGATVRRRVVAAGTASVVALLVAVTMGAGSAEVAAVPIGAATLAAGVIALVPGIAPSGRSLVRRLVAVGLAIVAVAGTAIAAEPLTAHAVPVEKQQTIPGAPKGVPAFYEPTDLAVNARGDVAVLERRGVRRDDIWVIPAGPGRPFRVVTTKGVQEDRATTVLTGMRGADPGAITAITWADADRLLLLTDRGLYATDVTMDSTPALLTRELRSSAQQGDHLLIVGKRLVVRGDSLRTSPATPSRPLCGDDSQGQLTPMVEAAGWDGSRLTSDFRVITDERRGCLPVTLAVAADRGRLAYLGVEQSADGSEGYRLTWGSFGDPAPVDLGEVDGADWSGGAFAVVTDGRLLISKGSCLYGRQLRGTAPMPVVVPDDGACATPAGLSLQPSTAGLRAARGDISGDSCPPTNRPTTLVVSRSLAPISAAPNDAAVMMDDPTGRCSSVPWRLPAGADRWSLMAPGRIASTSWLAANYAPGATATMSADAIEVERGAGGRMRWLSVGFDGYLSVGAATSAAMDLVTGTAERYWSGDLIDVALQREEDGTTALVLKVGRDDGFVTTTLGVDGLVDFVPLDDKHLLVARCGQLLDIDFSSSWYWTRPDDSYIDGSDLASAPVRVLLGSSKGLAAVCPTTSTTNRFDPVAVAPVPGGSDLVVAESARVAGRPVARLQRFDAETRRLTPIEGGDLARLGVVPTDVAVNSDGRIAVATASPDGYGPVLVVEDGHRQVLDLGGRWVSSLAWKGNNLVVTDARTGDVVVVRIVGS